MVVAYGKFSWQALQQAIVKTARTSTMVLIVLVGAVDYNVFLTTD
jgi:TRAP-type mannitol/chloroaromatic compound transport system permease large subunit